MGSNIVFQITYQPSGLVETFDGSTGNYYNIADDCELGMETTPI